MTTAAPSLSGTLRASAQALRQVLATQALPEPAQQELAAAHLNLDVAANALEHLGRPRHGSVTRVKPSIPDEEFRARMQCILGKKTA